jgi:hypothetical protein
MIAPGELAPHRAAYLPYHWTIQQRYRAYAQIAKLPIMASRAMLAWWAYAAMAAAEDLFRLSSP